MSKEGSPELTKSWVFVDPEKQNSYDDKDTKDTGGVQEVTESEPHGDSDTDSISVISESGCSYRTDEEECAPQGTLIEENESSGDNNLENEVKSEAVENEAEIIKDEPEIIEPKLPEPTEENKGIEKLLYFATSAVCAIVLIGLSVAIQQYLQGASDVNTIDPDQDFIYPHVQNVKTENVLSESPKKYTFKRKNQYNVDELENKIAKLEEVKVHDKNVSPDEDNDPNRERDLKSNYKLNKNKSFKCNKENCDAKNYKHEKIRRDENNDKTTAPNPDENERANDGDYSKIIKELRVKEDYLLEKEKFLIEKEHDLMKKEIKLNKEKEHYEKNKHDKNSSFKKGKGEKKSYFKKKEEYKIDSSEEESGGKKGKYKSSKEYLKEDFNTKNNKKYKHKEEKKEKELSAHKRYRFSDESDKKRNISGQWYISLHEARDQMRQRKRASFKKNKAHWYFQWMVDRARLRVK